MTKDKALELALEALEQTLQTLDDENAKPGGAIADTIWHSEHETLFDYLGSEITAIKDALAEHAMSEVQRLGQEIEQAPVAWLLTDKKINSLQVDDIQRLISRLKHAHHTDLCVRINGQDEWFEADWLKHMVRVTPPQRKPLTDEEIGAILEGVNAYGTRLYTFARAIEAAHGIKGEA